MNSWIQIFLICLNKKAVDSRQGPDHAKILIYICIESLETQDFFFLYFLKVLIQTCLACLEIICSNIPNFSMMVKLWANWVLNLESSFLKNQLKNYNFFYLISRKLVFDLTFKLKLRLIGLTTPNFKWFYPRFSKFIPAD